MWRWIWQVHGGGLRVAPRATWRVTRGNRGRGRRASRFNAARFSDGHKPVQTQSESTKINTMTTESKIWVVTVPSAYRFRNCLLGQGETKAEAMADAYGPKPWPKSARYADCFEMTFDELEQLKHSINDN